MTAVKNSLLILVGTVLILAGVLFLIVGGVGVAGGKEIGAGIIILGVGAFATVLGVICFLMITSASPRTSTATTTSEPPIPVLVPSAPSERRYYIHKGGQEFGPMSGTEVQARIDSREFSHSDLIWY